MRGKVAFKFFFFVKNYKSKKKEREKYVPVKDVDEEVVTYE